MNKIITRLRDAIGRQSAARILMAALVAVVVIFLIWQVWVLVRFASVPHPK
jgi:hypothetical protein